jgi:hypothetical protein
MRGQITGLVLLIFLLLVSGRILAQQDEYITQVRLKDGSVLEGKMTEYVDGEYIRMDIGGSEITIRQSSVKYIKHKNLSSIREYAFQESGYYHHSSLGLMPGFISPGNAVLGATLDHSSGYLFNRYAGAGLNLGMMNYSPFYGEVIYSLAAEFRGYLLGKYFSPYYLLRSGYGFNFKGERFLEADGGLFLNPAIGVRLTGKQSVNITAEIGLSFQHAHYRYETQWWDRSIIEKDVRYQRFIMKLGVLF